MSEKNHEVKGRPDPTELRPKKEPSAETVRQIGRAAVKGSKDR